MKKPEKKQMTVAEAGRKGGQKVRDERGTDFYVEIGRKGGARMKEIIEAGKKALLNQKHISRYASPRKKSR